jgi:23S rRNA (cytidine1920-2'-O)/16S rRNA (cytidine1409-2'-O)-methyltransferase
MLQHGAASVLAVDTGYGQIAHKLRVDARVSLRERCNARLLGAGELVELGTGNREQGTGKGAESSRTVMDDAALAISFLAMDVSFISATLVLPAVLRALVSVGTAWRVEAGREHVGKGGIVREQAGRDIAIERVRQCVAELGGTGIEVIDSPIHGMEGNWEYLLHTRLGGGESET